jgi:hypothetical protein
VEQGIACTNEQRPQGRFSSRLVLDHHDEEGLVTMSVAKLFLDCQVSSDLVIDRRSCFLSFMIAHMCFTAKTSVRRGRDCKRGAATCIMQTSARQGAEWTCRSSCCPALSGAGRFAGQVGPLEVCIEVLVGEERYKYIDSPGDFISSIHSISNDHASTPNPYNNIQTQTHQPIPTAQLLPCNTSPPSSSSA